MENECKSMMSRKDCLKPGANRCVFSLERKTGSDGADYRSSGNEFIIHICASSLTIYSISMVSSRSLPKLPAESNTLRGSKSKKVS
jgi:hypothetical protein